MTPKILPVKVGADPEIAVRSIEENRFVSAHGLVPGDKYTPHKVDKGQVLIDGTMLEYGIDPCSTPSEFIHHNKVVINKLKEMIGPKYEMVYDSSVFFDKFYMDKLPDSVKELGCSADFDAWADGAMNPAPKPQGVFANMRACGGHIHVSWTEDADIDSVHHRWDCVQIIKQLDTWLFPYLSLLEDEGDPRRTVYGGLGAFRPKPYGVEWRVPSNAWLKNEKVWPWLFNAVKWVVDQCLAGKLPVIKDKTFLDQRLKEVNISGTININYWDTMHHGGTPSPQYLWIGGFPKFPLSINKTKWDPQMTNGIAEGIRVAHSANTVNYDVNLDWENIGGQVYADTPPEKSILKMY
jgi:hypothetical protein